MEFSELIRQRYSCRKYTDQPVEPWKIDKIIEAGILAPTAVNKQPFHIFRMESEAAKETVRSCTSCHFGADTFLIIGADPKAGWVRSFDNYSFADVDAAIAAVHMLLMIQNLGLGTTWVGYFDAPALKKAFPVLEGLDLICIFPIGCPAEGPCPRHEERKSAEAMVKVL